MLKRYRERREEQMSKRMQASSRHKNMFYPRSETMGTEDILRKEAAFHSSIQLLAYQMYHEKRVTALDNWHSEAERILRYNHHQQKGEIQCLPKLYCYF